MNGKSLHRTYRNKNKQKEKMKKMEQKYERNKRTTRRWKTQKSFTNRRQKKIYIYKRSAQRSRDVDAEEINNRTRCKLTRAF